MKDNSVPLESRSRCRCASRISGFSLEREPLDVCAPRQSHLRVLAELGMSALMCLARHRERERADPVDEVRADRVTNHRIPASVS